MTKTPKPPWRKGDLVTVAEGGGDGFFAPGEELIVMGDPGEYQQRDGRINTRRNSTVLSKPEDASGRMNHYWVADEKIRVPAPPQEEVDEAIKSILTAPYMPGDESFAAQREVTYTREDMARAWDEGWRVGADDQKHWSDDVPGKALEPNPYRPEEAT